ncbi:MAG: TonB-dependent receptor [Bacteroidales bacterium]|nr:TonB-dependent receptor [Bacteroidales bacterium]MBN2820936.1 TonB-dependent receptor [Bacteroidales bacterium]
MKRTTNQNEFLRRLYKLILLGIIMLNALNIAYAQTNVMQGVISDENAQPMPGANVSVKGTSSGTISDMNGRFSIDLSDFENPVLTISFVGYLTEEVIVGDQSEINIQLIPDLMSLEEVLVVGYGVQRKSDLTGAIASVSSKNLSNTPSSGLVQALQGKAAGVQVFNNSGMPGAGITVRIRGINSITTVNGSTGGPLYIIDGIPGDINSINQNDIEHIEVLKDASSQAIYGSSGGNGVILITTKNGSYNQKPKIELSMYKGIQSNDLRVDLCNTEEWIQVYNSLQVNTDDPILDDPVTLPNTNWWDEISHNAAMEDYNLSVSSGTEHSKSLFSLGYFNQDGIVKKTDYKRYTIRLNSSATVAKRLTIGENINISATQQRGMYDNSSWGSIVAAALNTSPICYVRDTTAMSQSEASDKNIGWGGWGSPYYGAGVGNPAVSIYYDNRQTGTYRAAGNLFANLEIVKGLTYNQNFGFDVNFYEMDNYLPYYNVAVVMQNLIPKVERELDRNLSWNWQHVVDYKREFSNDQNIGIMAGFEASENFGKTLFGRADSLIKGGATPEFQVIDATLRSKGSDYYLSRGTAWHGAHYAYFGRANYDYKNILLAQVTYRYDGSTNFGPKYRFGSFPSFSTGFKFSELSYIKNSVPALSFGKIRFGWGVTGNDHIPSSKFYSLVDQQPRYGYIIGGREVPGGVALAPGNPLLHWETITTYNYGLDVNFFNNKLSITADYFNKNTSGMLQTIDLPMVAGRFGLPGTDGQYAEHVGGLTNKGIELTIGHKDKVGELNYSVDFNFTKIVSSLYDMYDSLMLKNDSRSLSKDGSAPGLFFGYQTDGLFRPEDADYILDPGATKERYVVVNQPYRINVNGAKVFLQNGALPGDLRFIDTNGDTMINDQDRVVIGDPNPKFTFGFTINLEYKGFDINCFFQGSYGNDIYNAIKSSWYSPTGSGNWSTGALDAYRDPVYDENGTLIDPGNTTSDQFRLVSGNNYRISDWYVEDGSYIRLKSCQFGYTLPKSMAEKFRFERFRIYVGGRNLITITRYTGTDPEIGGSDPTAMGIDWGVYPQVKMYNMGLNVTF